MTVLGCSGRSAPGLQTPWPHMGLQPSSCHAGPGGGEVTTADVWGANNLRSVLREDQLLLHRWGQSILILIDGNVLFWKKNGERKGAHFSIL